MEVRAVSKWVRKGPRKVRKFADMITGRPLAEARAILYAETSPSVRPLLNTLNSARANAENNHDLDPADLIVSQAFVDGGFRIPKLRPRARGRADRVQKKTCHITVVLSDEMEEDLEA